MGIDSNARHVAGGDFASGAITLLVLRRSWARDSRGEAAVAALLEEGQRLAEGGEGGAGGMHFTQLYVAHNAGGPHMPQFTWRDGGRRLSRPLSTVVLPGDTAERMLEDARAFLISEPWYIWRGLPYRCVRAMSRDACVKVA